MTEIRNGPPGIALWSRFPLTDPEVLDTGGMPRIRATVLLGARRLRFYNVHVVAPVGEDRARWKAELRRVEEDRCWWSPATSTPPATIPASGGSCGTGWRTPTSAAGGDGRRPGRGTDGAATLMRLDHVLVSPDIGVRSVKEGHGQGSDHRPIVAELCWAPRTSRSTGSPSTIRPEGEAPPGAYSVVVTTPWRQRSLPGH